MKLFSCLVSLALCAAASGGAQAGDRAFIPNFHLSVEVPAGAVVCRPGYPLAGHMVIFLLDSKDCNAIGKNAHVSFFASYNIGWEATSTFDLAKQLCESKNAHPTDIIVGGTTFYLCHPSRKKKHQDDYVALHEYKGLTTADATVYAVTFFCSRGRCQKDFEKTVMSSININLDQGCPEPPKTRL